MFQENEAIDAFESKADLEEVIEPGLPIVDAHHHLYDMRPLNTEFQQKVYLIEEIMKDINGSGHNICQTVFAQGYAYHRADGPEEMKVVGETEFAHGIAAMSRSGLYGETRLCTGIFSHADLRGGVRAEPVLEAHVRASENFRGIRAGYPSDLNETFLEGFRLLAKHNLTFDFATFDCERLRGLMKLASANPDVSIIVNHLGGKIDVNSSKKEINRWKACVASVAACSNTFMKLGGAQMRVQEWEPAYHMNRIDKPLNSDQFLELLYPYYLFCIDTFGPERCMFESNFPVDRECVSYRALWNLFKKIANKAGATDNDKKSLFSGTAASVYRLEL